MERADRPIMPDPPRVDEAELERRVAQRTAALRQANNRFQVHLMAWKISAHRYQAIFDQAYQFMALLTADGITLECNQTALTFAGLEREQVIGQPFWELPWWQLSPAHVSRLRQAVAEAAERRFVRFETDYRDAGETLATFDFSIKPVADESGQVVFLIAEGRDITQRKRSEAQLQRLAEELRRSNHELEQFAYAASHDLQEPLRMVATYTQLLARRYRGRLDADADEYIAFAVDGASRMQQLIKDLLAYSRVGTRGQPLAPVDLGAIVDQATTDLQLSIEEQAAAISRDPLPTIDGDATQLRLVFQNLFSNSLKYRGPEPPRIHVSASHQAAGWQLAVRDNGIGIEPEYAERIFIIFQRLHGRDRYPGTGVGLALCRKIIERHGGRIWVVSQPGQGATFYLTLPARTE